MVVVAVKNKKQFEALLKTDHLVVVDFYATWCGPCKMMGPKFEKMTDDFSNVVFAKVDIDAQEKLAVENEINLMPTFIFFRGSKEISRVEGTKEEDLRARIASLSKN